MTNRNLARIAFDPIWGVDSIAQVIGRNYRQTHYMLDRGLLPAKRVGGRWFADRNALIRFLSEPNASANQAEGQVE